MNETTTDATAIFVPLWRRKWLILAVGVLVAVGTYFYYKHQPSVYGASTEVYLGGSSEVQSLLGGAITGSSAYELADQAELINSNVIGEAVHRRLAARHQLALANGTVKATASTESDFITLASEAPSPHGAALLANTYAQAYLGNRDARYRAQVRAVIASTQHQLEQVRGSVAGTAASRSLQTQTLVEKIDGLESDLAVGNLGDRQVNPAVPNPVALSPKPVRNAIFGLALGLLLAACLAYALSRFDRRLRKLSDVEETLQTPVLTAVPSVSPPIRRNKDGVPVLSEHLREPLRRLHTTLQLQDLLEHELGSSPRSVLFVSAEAGAGKSTMVAGLALVQREAGERVAIVDADLRRPTQAGLLGVQGSQGLAEVLAGALPVGEALQRVQSPPPQVVADPGLLRSGSGLATAVGARQAGSVSVLASGSQVANPPALLARREMSELLGSLTDDFDHVLIDAPPPLQVSDAMPLLHIVDAIVIVARVAQTKLTAAEHLAQLLQRSASTPVLGVVANDVPLDDIEAYGLSSAYYDKH